MIRTIPSHILLWQHCERGTVKFPRENYFQSIPIVHQTAIVPFATSKWNTLTVVSALRIIAQEAALGDI